MVIQDAVGDGVFSINKSVKKSRQVHEMDARIVATVNAIRAFEVVPSLATVLSKSRVMMSQSTKISSVKGRVRSRRIEFSVCCHGARTDVIAWKVMRLRRG